MTENDNLDYLNKYMIPKFFDIKSNKTSHETLYNSRDGTKLISGYISQNNIVINIFILIFVIIL